jgi:hypothetical protein
MQFTIKKTVDILNLFLHEKYVDECSSIDETWLAGKLTEMLNNYDEFKLSDKYSYIEVFSPEETDLDRFTIEVETWKNYEEGITRYVDRCYTKIKLKKLLPSDIYKALQEINKAIYENGKIIF